MVAACIEDYAMIGDGHTAALVDRSGRIAWLCLPRFDSDACFASLLGTDENGHWTISPQAAVIGSRRRYRPGTLILETELTTADGCIRITDFMPHRHGNPTLIRIVEGISGRVPVRMGLKLRFDYGRSVPWVRPTEGGIRAIAGPGTVTLHAPVALHAVDAHTGTTFDVTTGARVPFVLTWLRSTDPDPASADPHAELERAEREWLAWSKHTAIDGPWREASLRALVALKAMIYELSGGVVAAATTSLPEQLGGSRNWDYRYCWLRDASLTIQAFAEYGCVAEAIAWRDWLLRAVAGDPEQLQIMYGLDGERWLPELELTWLPGYASSRPVRKGNGAAEQFQLDVYGEVMDAMHQARRMGMAGPRTRESRRRWHATDRRQRRETTRSRRH